MESADIADIYYPAFLANGAISRHYTAFEPGEKVRLYIREMAIILTLGPTNIAWHYAFTLL